MGHYSVNATKPGFESASKTAITLVVGQFATENLTLPVGQISLVVTVQEQQLVVNTTTEQTSGLVGERQVKELPLNGRSYDELMSLNPGVVNYTSQKAGGLGSSNSSIGNMFSASGRRPQETVFLLNGIEYTSASEINLTPGAQVNIATSSGTNQLHGTLYEFLRNSDLDARNFFDGASIAPFKRNEFGAALGGPIQKDKDLSFRQLRRLSAAARPLKRHPGPR